MKIDFNKNTNELFEVGNNSNNVTIDDTVNVDAIGELLEQYNAEYSLHRIKSNLEQDDRLTGDEVDHLMGAIDVLEEMENHESTGEIYIVKADISSGIVIEPETKTLNEVANDMKETLQKEKKERKKREVKVSTGVPIVSNKTINPQEFIKLLQEKIELTKLVSETQAPEIPEGLTKSGRDLMIKFCQDHNKLIAEYMGLIQVM